MSSDQQRLDIVIFGASGFTGKHTIPYVYNFSKSDGRKLTWGVAGRSRDKLVGVLDEFSAKLEVDFTSIPIIIADVGDEESLLNMAKRARVIVNCCGPYRFYGEPVVKACVEVGTHHVDVSGEPQYMERVQLDYHEKAKEKGVYIVSACGFDSIPTDLGVVFLEKNFGGTLNSVETYLQANVKGGASGAVLNYGTWESAIYGLTHYSELRALRSKLFPNKLPAVEPKLKPRSVVHKSPVSDGWSVPFMGSDRSVVNRSQRVFYELEKKRPVQIQTYMTIASLFNLAILALFGALFIILTKFAFTRNLLLKYPCLFSMGYVSREGPSEELQKNTHFSVTLYGEGWKEKLAENSDAYKQPVDKAVIAKVSGTNPGYGATCVALVLAAIVVITETDKLPGNGKGGVYPPGAAFAKTSLIEQLQKNGLKFEVLKTIER